MILKYITMILRDIKIYILKYKSKMILEVLKR